MLSAIKILLIIKYLGVYLCYFENFGRKRILKYTTKRCFKYDCNSSKYWVSIADGVVLNKIN